MVVKNPHYRSRQQSDRVTTSTASRQLFSPVRSRQDATPLSLDAIASAIFPDCPNSVALRYSHETAQPQYEPYADFNLVDSTDTTGTREVVAVDILEYAKQFSNTSAFVPPHYTTEDINLIEKQTKQQSECQMWRTVHRAK
jgi:hypothetical protein